MTYDVIRTQIDLKEFFTHPDSDTYTLWIDVEWDTNPPAIIDYDEPNRILSIEGTETGSIEFDVKAQILDQIATSSFQVNIVQPELQTTVVPDFSGADGFTIDLSEYYNIDQFPEMEFNVTGSYSVDTEVILEDSTLFVYGTELDQFTVDIIASLYDFTSHTQTINVDITSISPFEITGATNEFESGGYKYYEFRTPGTLRAFALGKENAEVLLIGGGGGGGTNSGGGGGGGQVFTTGSLLKTPFIDITVGNGGNGGTTSPATNGQSTLLSNGDITFESFGGGRGAGLTNISTVYGAAVGASGGGGRYSNYHPGGGAQPIEEGVTGYRGSSRYKSLPKRSAGAGGGFSEAGIDPANGIKADGGNGTQIWFYPGGGGGGGYDHNYVHGREATIGGFGGGGGGASTTVSPVITAKPGAPNTGGGGGGGSNFDYPGQPGGSGIIVIRVPI